MFIICNDPCEDGCVLLLPITGWTNELCDATCKIDEWQHKPLTKDSYIIYRYAKIVSASSIEKGIKDGVLRQSIDINAALFLRASQGIMKSPQTKPKVKAYWKNLTQ